MSDVIVVGAGNAALCAAIAAREAGARVLVLEAAPAAEAGGNSAYTAGAMRVAYRGAADLRPLLDAPEEELELCDFGSYPSQAFVDDVMRVTDGRADAELTAAVAGQSLQTLGWMAGHGVAFEPSYRQQAFEQDGRWRFWGGLAVRVRAEGKGLVAALRAGASRLGVEVREGVRADSLVMTSRGGVAAVRTAAGEDLRAGAVVLACGGFEADAGWRERHLGEGWQRAKVRGTRFNTGAGIRMALEVGAQAWGDWSGCHSVAWDRDAPETGNLEVAHEYTRNSYQFGIVAGSHGRRFLDEGADFRNYTYAAYGREVLRQPGGVAWQVFDGKVLHLLRREYHRPDASVVRASTPEALAHSMDGVDADRLLATVREFNGAVRTGVPFDPAARDSRGTDGLPIPKSNWANTIDTPPFLAYPVTCGITFTFGGLRTDPGARVLDERGRAIPGLFAAGELVGGLWYGNYAGGSGLTAGAVLGRAAGLGAARADAP